MPDYGHPLEFGYLARDWFKLSTTFPPTCWSTSLSRRKPSDLPSSNGKRGHSTSDEISIKIAYQPVYGNSNNFYPLHASEGDIIALF